MKTLPAKQLAAFLDEAKKTGVYEMYYKAVHGFGKRWALNTTP